MEVQQLPKDLQKLLRRRLSLIRLAKTGFFRKAESPHPSIAHELMLHRAILDKALIDSFSVDDDIRMDVEHWLDLMNPDFVDCCDNAMLDPKGVHASFKLFKKILRGENARFKGFGANNNDS